VAAKDKLIVALDVQTAAEAYALQAALHEVVGMFKIGSQLFTTAGPTMVKAFVTSGTSVFLDLKFHDIPHQVAGAARAAAELCVSLFTVHASGGAEMMRRAVEAVAEVAEREGTPRSRIVAVSVLTSMDASKLDEIGIHESPAESVQRLVKLAAGCGVDGSVASPHEAAAIRSITGPGFLIVTPGIRPTSADSQVHHSASDEDQRRVATPAAALAAGADYLVVGRPITGAKDPVAAAQSIAAEMESALSIKGSGTAKPA
jgi:orotidine-5'-phosphate decarboxylase